MARMEENSVGCQSSQRTVEKLQKKEEEKGEWRRRR
jgi:hypothetical protein